MVNRTSNDSKNALMTAGIFVIVLALVMVAFSLTLNTTSAIGSNWAQVLVTGNLSGGTDAVFTDGDNIINPAKIQMDADASTPAHSEGVIFYDEIDQTLSLFNEDTEVSHQLGQEGIIRVYNGSGGDIADGSIVYISGTEAIENRPAVELADATTRDTSRVIGFATHTIEDGTFGFVTYWGLVRNLDTSLFTAGDDIYLSEITPGGFEAFHPGVTGFLIHLGYVVRVDASAGTILATLQPDLSSPEIPLTKSYSITTQGGFGSGDFWVSGFYDWDTSDANLTQASLTVNHGTAANPNSAHVSIVTGGVGTVDTGVVSLVVSGTSIDDTGVRTTSDSETILADITTSSTDAYYETSKKWLGQITYTLTIVSGAPTTYALDFNYGFSAYDDWAQVDLIVEEFEITGIAGANDTGFEAVLYHHDDEDWNYAATGFTPTPHVIVSSVTDLGGDDNLTNNLPFKYKRTGITHVVNTSQGDEGVIARITTSANNAISFANIQIAVHLE